MHTYESVILCVTYRSPYYCFFVFFDFKKWNEPKQLKPKKWVTSNEGN